MAHSQISPQQVTEPGSKVLSGRTILMRKADGRCEIVDSLRPTKARILNWPKVQILAPPSFDSLDEAIENLFGYDWIILRNVHVAEAFVNRFQQLKHDATELDSVHVFAVGEATSNKLSSSQIHVDLLASQEERNVIVSLIENYLGRDAIAQTNLLNLRAAASAETISQSLEDLGARVDTAVAYRTVADSAHLVQLTTLLRGGGIDCLILRNGKDIEELAELFDTADLANLFKDTVVACLDPAVAREARRFGLSGAVVAQAGSVSSFADLLIDHLSAV